MYHGEEIHGSCMELEEQIYGGDDNHNDDGNDDECWRWEEDDCMSHFEGVEGLESCWYNMWVNDCTGEEDMASCEAWATLNGEEFNGGCEELTEMFGGDD